MSVTSTRSIKLHSPPARSSVSPRPRLLPWRNSDMTAPISNLAGVLPVFQTPYHDDESIDADTLHREIDWLYDCGSDGIVMAMVSEVLRLSSDERRHLAELACRFGRP